MRPDASSVLWILSGYLCGSIPFGVLLTRWWKGVDVREHGSGNIGATNVARVGGTKLGIVVLLLDALKGAAPVIAATHWQPGWTVLHSLVGLSAFLGHVFPIWLKLRGGKGVATALGVLVGLVPWAALVGLGLYALCFALFRVSSVGSLVGGLGALATAALSNGPPPYVVVAGALFLLMVFTHRGNIRRLLKREERRL